MKAYSFLFMVLLLGCSAAFAGTGTEMDPYTIAEAVALSAGPTEYWAQGYIVGGAYDNFDSPWTSDYSISCADTDSESDVDNCLQVKLESDGGRTTWGLASNPDNYQKQIKFRGYRDSYGAKPSFEGVDNTDISEVALENQPPVLDAIGNKSVVWSNTLTFSVTANDTLDGDDIVLSATELPAGATFPGVTNASTASSTFTWTDAGPMGVYTTTFWAVDNDGTNSETITITVGDGSGPEEIAFQGFEGTGADTWGIDSGSFIQSDTGAGDTPASQRIRTGSYSWQPGHSSEQPAVLELDSVDVSSYSDVMVTLHLSATTTDTNDYGMWPGDAITFSLALDGGTYNADMIITGNEETGGAIEGVLWGYAATGVAATTAGVTRTMTPAGGGMAADGLATVRIAVPDGTASVQLKASSYNYEDYSWNVDDISLSGVNDGGAADYPPSISIEPDDTSLEVPVSNAVSFVISGREIPNDAADTVTLSASGLPAGATFPEVSGPSILTNTFNWTPTATGTTVVSFFAGDKDGTNQLDVTINVFEQQPVGTYRAVICGISDYDGSDNDLSYCDDDAQELYDRLLSGSNWEAANMQLLLDSQATEANIQSAITAMGNASVEGDVCLFFFSGHGGGDLTDTDGDEDGDGVDEYLCPYYLYDNEITDDELSDWLDDLPTDNLIVLLDTCFSGGHLKAPVGSNYKGISRTGIAVTDKSNGFVDDLRKRSTKDIDDLTSPYIATACDEEELSEESSELQNGVFAYYLLEALTNADANVDGWLAGEEAFEYLEPKTVAYNPSQHPQEYDGWPGLADIVTWGPIEDAPPTLAIDPAGTSKTVTFDEELTFTVTATDPDGEAVSLSVSNLPSGATAPDDSGTGTAASTFTWTPAEAQVGSHSVDFYATDVDGTTHVTVSISVNDGSTAADLFISEYVEGSSNNKYIEVFNGTGGSVDLSDYSLRLYANGGSSPNNDVDLSGTLASGEVKVYQNSSATAYSGAAEDSAACNFNGNDAVALAKNSSNIDVVGTIGSSAMFAEDVTLVRKSTVMQGNTTFTTGEWDEYAKDTVSDLGSHEMGAPVPSAPVFNALGTQAASVDVPMSFTVSATGSPTPTLALAGTTASGGYSFTIGTGELAYTPPAADLGAMTFTFTASNASGVATQVVDVTVSAAPVLIPVASIADVSSNSFTVNWTAVTGATDYQVQVATDSVFSASGGDNLMSNGGFETGDSTDWDTFESGYSVVTTDPQEGSYAVECVAGSTRDLMQNVDITGDGVTEYEISYYYRVTAGDGTDVRIWSSWTAGGQESGDELQPATYNPDTSDWAKMTYHVVPSSGANTLRFEVRCYSGSTVYLDNFFVGEAAGGGGSSAKAILVDETVSALTYPVTGLDPETPYYARVRAAGGTWSDVVTETTLAAGVPPQEPITDCTPPEGGSGMTMQIQSMNGITYELEYTLSLFPPVWVPVDSEVGDGSQIELADPDALDTMRFYRVVQP